MADDYWKQRATLFRNAGGMALVPDAPIWLDAGEIAQGTLSEMIERGAELPLSHQPYHCIKIAGGQLGEASIRALIDQPRHEAS